MARRSPLLEVSVDVLPDECCATVLASSLTTRDAEELAAGFTALADPVRLRLLNLLARSPDGEVCICNLVGPIGKSQPTISHHMSLLAKAGLVHGERRTKWVWYSIDRERLAALRAALDA